DQRAADPLSWGLSSRPSALYWTGFCDQRFRRRAGPSAPRATNETYPHHGCGGNAAVISLCALCRTITPAVKFACSRRWGKARSVGPVLVWLGQRGIPESVSRNRRASVLLARIARGIPSAIRCAPS